MILNNPFSGQPVPDSGGLDAGATVGIVVAVVLFLIVVAVSFIVLVWILKGMILCCALR